MFQQLIDGYVVLPSNNTYKDVTNMHNKLFTRFPAIVVMVLSTDDIKQSILFASKYNLHVVVKSSGHDYIGRSSWSGSIQINLGYMRKMKVMLSTSRSVDGELTVESGANWQEIYQEVDKYNRVVVGGSSQTVSPSGYTLGGGHSILSRMLGLAVDQVLEMTVITVNGSIIKCTNHTSYINNPDGSFSVTSDTSLFWALRGGGGGTFGIVASFTFKLHKIKRQYVKVTMTYPLSINGNSSIGQEVMQFYSNFVKGMPNEWGGYSFLSNAQHVTKTNESVIGTLGFLYCHYGGWNDSSRKYMDLWNDFHPEWRLEYTVRNISTFWEGFGSVMTDSPWNRVYVTGSFIQEAGLDTSLKDFIVETMTRPINDTIPLYACVGTHLGGRVSDFSDTPVHPGFRHARLCLGCVVAIPDITREDFYIKKGKELSQRLISYGNGTYVNEAAEYMSNWQQNYWGPHYSRLLSIKREVDPDNILTCHHCVGSEL
ncbi:uncharacterized protein LOC127726958 [Mytilus californianus]|uniref:uncharacterized protein LOC127726958 n=1 Tax=Mytilus californianus TaxID=6549 RepID=UPI0022460DE1|nr:uncharacterized protein LOC127726958 [Mytilus californianus]